MVHRLPGILVGLFGFSSSMPIHAAPTPPVGPMTIRGSIEEIAWHPDRFVNAYTIIRNGKRLHPSGSLGHDRTFPANYAILLVQTTVQNEKGANPAYSFAGGTPLRIFINHTKNDGFLKKGMRIAVYGYTVRGDEGGNWYAYRKISLLH